MKKQNGRLQFHSGLFCKDCSVIPMAANMVFASCWPSVVGFLGGSNLRKPALVVVELGAVVFAKAEEATGICSDNRKQFLLLLTDCLPCDDHHLLAVKRFGGRFSRIQSFSRLGGFHPGFQNDDGSSNTVCQTNQPGGVGKTVLRTHVLEAGGYPSRRGLDGCRGNLLHGADANESLGELELRGQFIGQGYKCH